MKYEVGQDFKTWLGGRARVHAPVLSCSSHNDSFFEAVFSCQEPSLAQAFVFDRDNLVASSLQSDGRYSMSVYEADYSRNVYILY